jgi:hypothetical protein
MRRNIILLLVQILSVVSLQAQSGVISNFDSYTAPSPFHTYPLKGSPLLFDDSWAHARVELPDNRVIQNDSLFFNYNKMTQSLFITKDFKRMIEVDKREFKSVTFFWRDSVYILEHVNLINKSDFFMELVRDNNKYSLYKFIVTVFKDISYHSSGLVKEGNDYGELTDHPVYYIVFPNKEYRTLKEINDKSVRRIFKLSPDSKKVEDWLSSKNKMSNENDIWDLVTYLNG